MTIFIPVTDYATSANSAEELSSIEVGYIQAGTEECVNFRIGNRDETTMEIVISSDNPAVTLSIDTLTLEPDQISDTLTATISTPIDCKTEMGSATISAGNASLELLWGDVGANLDRIPQVPDRMGDFTDTVTNVFDRTEVSEALRLWTFDPIAYDPDDDRIFVMPEGTSPRFKSQRDVCCRLDPLDTRWGYTQSVQTVVGSFQSEEWSITTSYSRDNSSVTYSGSAVLYLPAGYELRREWALFALEKEADRTQYKRTVFVTQRQGQVWALWSIVPIYRGTDLAYWHCPLIPLRQSCMGSVESYNPFAYTYEDQSDRPYACFSCQTAISFTELLSNPSVQNPSEYPTVP